MTERISKKVSNFISGVIDLAQSEFSLRPPLTKVSLVTNDPVFGHLETFKLSNGIPVTLIPRPGSPITTVVAVVGAGTSHEKDCPSGTAHFLEHLVFQGTKEFSDRQAFEDELGKCESAINAHTGRDSTTYYIQVPGGHTSRALHILQQMIFEPLILPEKVEHEKGIILSELTRSYRPSSDDLLAEVFPNIGFQNDILGTKDSISEMSSEALKHFHSKFYGPENITLYMVGDLPKTIDSLAEFEFGSFKSSDILTESYREILRADKSTKVRFDLFKSNNTREKFIYDLSEESRESPVEIELLNRLVGGKGPYSLFSKLRTNLGVAYSVRVEKRAHLDTRWLEIDTEVPSDKSIFSFREIKSALIKFSETEISEKEKDSAVTAFRSSLRHECQEPLAAVDFLKRFRLEYPNYDGTNQLFEGMAKVTPRELKSTSERVFGAELAGLFLYGGIDEKEFYKYLMETLRD